MVVRGAEAPFELGGAPVRMVAFIHTLALLPSHSKPQVRLAWKLPPTATGRLVLASLRAPGATMGMWRSRTWDAPATVPQQ